MRLLITNDGWGDAGGVQVYLEAVVRGLQTRGHEIAVLHRNTCAAPPESLRQVEQISTQELGFESAMQRVVAWEPSLVFSHNMDRLDVEEQLLRLFPVVKFMHGYFGTCLSGLKTRRLPSAHGCDRSYGPACLGLYYPCRCGQMAPSTMLRQWRWTEHQRSLLGRYQRIVVASEHMRDEFVRTGGDPGRVATNPLFTTATADATPQFSSRVMCVAFMGRMTTLKGGDTLVRAVDYAARALGRPVRLVMIGDGPQRPEWEALAASESVPAEFTGWIDGAARWTLLRSASVIAIPSVWPEPFGLVGLEAGTLGIPAIACDTGGIREWLRDGVNGLLVPSPCSARSFGDVLHKVLSDVALLRKLGAGAREVAGEMNLERHLDRLESIFGWSSNHTEVLPTPS